MGSSFEKRTNKPEGETGVSGISIFLLFERWNAGPVDNWIFLLQIMAKFVIGREGAEGGGMRGTV